MDELDRSLVLYRMGLRSECLGPPIEWDPKSPAEFQRRHTTFWEEVAELIEDEPGEYEDLPNWMTEVATEQLQANN